MGLGLGRSVLSQAATQGSAPVRDATRQRRVAAGAVAPDPGLGVVFGAGVPASAPLSYTPAPAGPSRPRPPATSQPAPQKSADEMWADFIGQTTDGTPIIFGRTEDGKYAGWGTRSDMVDAVTGYGDKWRTESLADADRVQADAQRARDDYMHQAYARLKDANRQISEQMPTYDAFGGEGLDAAYAKYLATANAMSHGHSEGTLSKDQFAKQHISSGADVKWDAPGTERVLLSRTETAPAISGNPFEGALYGANTDFADYANYVPGVSTPASDTQYADVYGDPRNRPTRVSLGSSDGIGVDLQLPTPEAPPEVGYQGASMWDAARAKSTVEPNYEGRIHKWQQDATQAWDPYLDVAANVEQMSPRDWALAAAAKYGLSPDVANGIFDASWGNSQRGSLRDQASWDQNGMPYSEYATAAEKAAAAAEKDQEQAVYDQASQIAFDTYGVDVKQAADAADLTPDQAFDVLGSTGFRDAYARIVGVDPLTGQTTGSAPYIDGTTGKVDEGNLAKELRDLYVNNPPAYRMMLEVLGKDIFPTGVNNPLYDDWG